MNIMRRMFLPESMKISRMGTIWLKLVKIASRVVRHGRRIQYKLCSSYPCRKDFFETLTAIQNMRPVTVT